MPLKSVYLLGLCAGSAVLTGIGRFAFQPSLPQPLLDGLFLISVVATLSVSVHIVAKSLSRHAQDELAEIEKARREK